MVYLTMEKITYMIFEVMKFKGKGARTYKKYLVPLEGTKLKGHIYCCYYIILGRSNRSCYNYSEMA